MFSKTTEKIFCIGLNKTGTTTIETVLSEFNYKLGNQTNGELLLDAWYKRDFKKIIRFSKTADAFQDIPFSLPFTYVLLNQHFRNSKFILTVRNDSNQWYNSITKFHSKLWSKNNEIPTAEDLKNANYLYKGFPYEFNRKVFKTPFDDPYNKSILTTYYNNHNYSVLEFFRSNPEKLITINVAVKNDYLKLCDFLNKKPVRDDFPWTNKT